RREWHCLKPRISVIPASEPGSRVAESKQFTGYRRSDVSVKPGMTMLLVYSDFTLKAVPFPPSPFP
ncbi:MAG: hypothetical protein O6703_00470, partial [Gammaproteobacteria bacterium]|nr:hypothetical protein [Gammaproteobacteria bacterium]